MSDSPSHASTVSGFSQGPSRSESHPYQSHPYSAQERTPGQQTGTSGRPREQADTHLQIRQPASQPLLYQTRSLQGRSLQGRSLQGRVPNRHNDGSILNQEQITRAYHMQLAATRNASATFQSQRPSNLQAGIPRSQPAILDPMHVRSRCLNCTQAGHMTHECPNPAAPSDLRYRLYYMLGIPANKHHLVLSHFQPMSARRQQMRRMQQMQQLQQMQQQQQRQQRQDQAQVHGNRSYEHGYSQPQMEQMQPMQQQQDQAQAYGNRSYEHGYSQPQMEQMQPMHCPPPGPSAPFQQTIQEVPEESYYSLRRFLVQDDTDFLGQQNAVDPNGLESSILNGDAIRDMNIQGDANRTPRQEFGENLVARSGDGDTVDVKADTKRRSGRRKRTRPQGRKQRAKAKAARGQVQTPDPAYSGLMSTGNAVENPSTQSSRGFNVPENKSRLPGGNRFGKKPEANNSSRGASSNAEKEVEKIGLTEEDFPPLPLPKRGEKPLPPPKKENKSRPPPKKEEKPLQHRSRFNFSPSNDPEWTFESDKE